MIGLASRYQDSRFHRLNVGLSVVEQTVRVYSRATCMLAQWKGTRLASAADWDKPAFNGTRAVVYPRTWQEKTDLWTYIVLTETVRLQRAWLMFSEGGRSTREGSAAARELGCIHKRLTPLNEQLCATRLLTLAFGCRATFQYKAVCCRVLAEAWQKSTCQIGTWGWDETRQQTQQAVGLGLNLGGKNHRRTKHVVMRICVAS